MISFNHLGKLIKVWPPLCKSLFNAFLFVTQCRMYLLNIIFWSDSFYWMLQGVGIGSFTLDNFDSINAWLFSSLTENYKFKKSICESRESFKIFVAHVFQHRVYDPVFSYYFKTSKQLLNMHIIFVYNSNCGRQTLSKLLNKGGVFFSSRTWQRSWKKIFFLLAIPGKWQEI